MASTNGRSHRRSAAERRELAIQALNMKVEGKPYDEIATHFGVGTKTIARWVNTVLEQRTVEGLEQYRATTEARLDKLIQELHEMLQDTGNTVSQRLKVINELAEIEKQRAQLLGLNKPVEQSSKLKVQYDDEEYPVEL